MVSSTDWQRTKRQVSDHPRLGLRLDWSRMGISPAFLDSMREKMLQALADMVALEQGSIANPDENRRVGHYWLRAPWLAPTSAQTRAIESTISRVSALAAEVHSGLIAPPSRGAQPAQRFQELVVIGIGGSALGPQLLADALGDPRTDAMRLSFLDNTDPDGLDRTLEGLDEAGLERALFAVISKSGGTQETRNAMLVSRARVESKGLDFPPRAVAITAEGSALDQLAVREGWLARLPMWDFVGGRTSVTSAVGLLPAALQGLDTADLLAGAAACDEATREADPWRNPAALLAVAWYHATGGQGERDMVVLPYRDRLLLFSRYLQQLVMESLGKGEDRAGQPVSQGIAVYGNKGSTDQHAFVQQLRDGLDNFFVTFIQVLADGESAAAELEVDDGVTAGDYLRGFLLGTRRALSARGRLSLTLTVPRLDAWSLGVLIALYERAVGLYASLIDVNAYHQPGVEAGKRAAAAVLAIQSRLLEHLAEGGSGTAEALAETLGIDDVETVYAVLEGLAANHRIAHEPAEVAFAGHFRRRDPS